MNIVGGVAKVDRSSVVIFVSNHFAKSVFCETLVALEYQKLKIQRNGSAIVVHLKKLKNWPNLQRYVQKTFFVNISLRGGKIHFNAPMGALFNSVKKQR